MASTRRVPIFEFLLFFLSILYIAFIALNCLNRVGDLIRREVGLPKSRRFLTIKLIVQFVVSLLLEYFAQIGLQVAIWKRDFIFCNFFTTLTFMGTIYHATQFLDGQAYEGVCVAQSVAIIVAALLYCSLLYRRNRKASISCETL